jgi:cytochrome c oxidase subunit II
VRAPIGTKPARRRWVRVGILATTTAVALGACAPNAKQSTLTPHGSVGRQLNSLFFPVFWIAVGVFCLVAGLVAFCVVRFRARSDDEAPKQVHGNTRLEITWTILPALLLAGIAIPTVKMVFDVNRYPVNAMRVDVTGHRWWWQFQYPGTNINTATELHIPTGQKVVLVLGSDDVIHNFWVPELAGKIYAIPGRHNNLMIEADQPATYYGQCAEFCGTSHSNMRFRVVAQTPADYQTWLSQQEQGANAPSSADATAGKQLFSTLGCAGCHTIQGISAGVVGPDLTHFKSRSCFAGCILANTDNNVRAWLQNPPALKPDADMPDMNLSVEQINQLVAYLDTLK